MPASVYLADLRHDFGGVLATDCMPLGIGYMKAVMDRELPDVRSRVFAYPGRLAEAIESSPPDVLMLTNYVWNEALSLRFARLAKSLRPDALVVFGGPNLPNEPDRQLAFMQDHESIDVYVLGEGDFRAAELVRRVVEAGTREVLEDEPPSSSLVRRRDGRIVHTPTGPREQRLDEIPSPWLTGVMDDFFDGRLAPMIETNRGCPFRCTFCVQGTSWYTKVHYFDQQRIEEELDYIGAQIRRRSPAMGTLRIADANYGMYERDVAISRHIGRMQKKYGWPTFIDATTGKNRPDRILKSLEEVNGALVLYQAVQSLDEDVLRNVKRSNIKLAAYEEIQMYMRGRGLRSNSDLILGLPGETLDSHLAALFRMIDAGVNQMHCFQAMMLKGSELESREARELFQFQTRFRVLPKNFGIYADAKVFDVEEIIVATDTLPFDDYLTARKHHLTFSVFWNDGWFEPLVEVARRHGFQSSDWLRAMLDAMESGSPEVRQFLSEFLDETRNELFETREACREFYARAENFERLRRGDVGDNLMYKYRARASFLIWPEICRCALQGTRRLLDSRGIGRDVRDFDRLWADFQRFIELRHASGENVDEMLPPRHATFAYDIPRWLDDGAPLTIAAYRYEEPQTLEFYLADESAQELTAAFQVWRNSLTGLSKLVTRIRTKAQIRQWRVAESDERRPSRVALPSAGPA